MLPRGCLPDETSRVKRLVALACLLTLPVVAAASPKGVSVTNVWSRPATKTAVVYATLRNDSSAPDRLIGATSTAATSVELHESTATTMSGGQPEMAGMTMPMNGTVMSMISVSFIPVPAHGVTSLSPGGYHLMLHLRSDLHAGQSVPLKLHFARSGWLPVTARVRPI